MTQQIFFNHTISFVTPNNLSGQVTVFLPQGKKQDTESI